MHTFKTSGLSIMFSIAANHSILNSVFVHIAAFNNLRPSCSELMGKELQENMVM